MEFGTFVERCDELLVELGDLAMPGMKERIEAARERLEAERLNINIESRIFPSFIG